MTDTEQMRLGQFLLSSKARFLAAVPRVDYSLEVLLETDEPGVNMLTLDILRPMVLGEDPVMRIYIGGIHRPGEYHRDWCNAFLADSPGYRRWWSYSRRFVGAEITGVMTGGENRVIRTCRSYYLVDCITLEFKRRRSTLSLNPWTIADAVVDACPDVSKMLRYTPRRSIKE